ncbi:hypothetical protein Tco_1091128 [Tanacetum coccineum]|uniref:Uncharacterized protein n=1 Tax=Tanacetum coccineum TaxID=301880 RepID=A0ABQ5I7J2_9ASTR
MAIAVDESSVRKANARSGQWVEITMKKVQRLLSITDGDERKHVLDYTHVDLHYMEDQRKNLLSLFNSLNKSCPHDPLPPFPKLPWVQPIGTSNDEIPLADLTLTLIVPKKTKQVTNKVSPVNVAKKKTQIMSPFVLDLCLEKKADLSTEQFLLTLMEEGVQNLPKANKRHGMDLVNTIAVVKKTIAKLKAQSSQGSSSRKAPMISKPYIDYKYYGFNDHHSDEYEYYPGCDICGSIAYETADCVKKPSSNNRKPRNANRRSTEPTKM